MIPRFSIYSILETKDNTLFNQTEFFLSFSIPRRHNGVTMRPHCGDLYSGVQISSDSDDIQLFVELKFTF